MLLQLNEMTDMVEGIAEDRHWIKVVSPTVSPQKSGNISPVKLLNSPLKFEDFGCDEKENSILDSKQEGCDDTEAMQEKLQNTVNQIDRRNNELSMDSPYSSPFPKKRVSIV